MAFAPGALAAGDSRSLSRVPGPHPEPRTRRRSPPGREWPCTRSSRRDRSRVRRAPPGAGTGSCRPGGRRLARRAEPRAPAADHEALDRRAAARTGLAAPAVHLELVLHRAFGAARIAVVPKRRPLPGESDAQYRAKPAVEPRHL